jgi:hypothetical protein
MRRSTPAADDVASTEPANPGPRFCIFTCSLLRQRTVPGVLQSIPDGITASAIHPRRWIQRWHSGSPDFQNSVTPIVDRNWLVSIRSLETHSNEI